MTAAWRYVTTSSPMRLKARIPGPSPWLEPHYRPWPCPNSADTAIIIGSRQLAGYGSCAAGYLHPVELDRRDRRDAEWFDFELTPNGLRVRERSAR